MRLYFSTIEWSERRLPGACQAEVPKLMCGFPKIRGTILGVPIIRTITYLGVHIGVPLILGNYPVSCR